MSVLSNKILKAINKGINEALSELIDDEEDSTLYTSRSHSISLYAKLYKKELIWIMENFVDLDLPSGTLWCKYNLGADSPEQLGDLYAWAELDPKDEYTWDNYKYGTNVDDIQKYTKKWMLLELSDDAAYQSNNNMCIPTKEQCDELINETNTTWVNINGQEFLKFESKTNADNYIIVAFELSKNIKGISNVGFWSNTVAGSFTGAGSEAYTLQYDGGIQRLICISEYRRYGHHIRPVLLKK